LVRLIMGGVSRRSNSRAIDEQLVVAERLGALSTPNHPHRGGQREIGRIGNKANPGRRWAAICRRGGAEKHERKPGGNWPAPKNQPKRGMKAGEEAADEPDGEQRRKADPESERSSEFHVAGSHDSKSVEKQQKAKSHACTEQGGSPVVRNGCHPQCQCRNSQEGACEHKPIGDAALPDVINGNEKQPHQIG